MGNAHMTLQTFSRVRSGRGGLGHLLRDLLRLVQSWWTVDRIRASPREGALLRMPVGTVIRIVGESWVIEKRWICDGATGPLVRYECGNGVTTATLEVRAASQFCGDQIRWKSASVISELHVTDIEVYESGR
jgi:hypothetical protein